MGMCAAEEEEEAQARALFFEYPLKEQKETTGSAVRGQGDEGV
jgi:hypothetical protein